MGEQDVADQRGTFVCRGIFRARVFSLSRVSVEKNELSSTKISNFQLILTVKNLIFAATCFRRFFEAAYGVQFLAKLGQNGR